MPDVASDNGARTVTGGGGAVGPIVRMPSRDEQDRRWAVDVQRGSLAAFERIARAYQGPLLRFLSRRMGNVDDAEDVAQETFVLAYRRIATYDPRWRLSAWLFAIAVRQAATHGRKRGRTIDARRATVAGSIDPRERMERDERRHNLWSVARRVLANDAFDALWMFYAEEMSVADVATVLGKNRLATRVLLHRARLKLKPFLANEAVGQRPTEARR